MVALMACVDIAGEVFMVSVALLLVADGEQVPLTTQRYWLLLNDTVTPVSVSDEDVAPE
jgi:hypothetical protein